jgi:hypothetical protein
MVFEPLRAGPEVWVAQPLILVAHLLLDIKKKKSQNFFLMQKQGYICENHDPKTIPFR